MPKKIAPSFYFIGNHPALDFVNTQIAADGRPLDLLDSLKSLLEWMCKSELISQEQADLFEQQWVSGNTGEQIVTAARKLRSGLHALIEKQKKGEKASQEDLAPINELLESQVVTTKLLITPQGFVSERHVNMQEPLDLISPIAESAIDLLSRYPLHFVKKCENPACVLYFYDNSKNSTRRWCSQKTCGNRMKVTAYLERQRNKKETTNEP